jgi:hypothetical protein
MRSHEGDDVEAAVKEIIDGMVEILESDNNTVTEMNVLIFRCIF